MSRRVWGSSLLGLLLLGLSTLPASAISNDSANTSGTTSAARTTGTTSATRSSLTTAEFEARVLSLINARRKAVGCYAFRTNSLLTTAARRHTARMVAAHQLSHQLSGEASLGTRITKIGYTHWRMLAENIAWGPTTPYGVYSLWMHSSGHRANMQRCFLRDAGVGMAWSSGKAWVTADFGRR